MRSTLLSLATTDCRYVEPESLEGDNQYSTEQYGKQDATCFVKFSHLPPVLHLHLKRFEFNTTTYAMEKVNSRFEFAERIDLSEFVDEALGDEVPAPTVPVPTATTSASGELPSPSAIATAAAAERASKSSGPHTYRLHSVLVHSGGVGGGHYYAFVRPNLGFCFESADPTQIIDFGDGSVDLKTTREVLFPSVIRCVRRYHAPRCIALKARDVVVFCSLCLRRWSGSSSMTATCLLCPPVKRLRITLADRRVCCLRCFSGGELCGSCDLCKRLHVVEK